MRPFFTMLFLYTYLTFSQSIIDKAPWFPPYTFTSVVFINDTYGWMTTDSNVLMKSTDGGITWVTINNVPLLKKIFVHSADSLIAAGVNNLPYKSTDGGITWIPINFPSGFTIKVIYALDFNTIYAAGTEETILRTTNCGSNWQLLRIIPNSIQKFDLISFSDKNHGWFTSSFSSYLLKTTDSGNSWLTYSLEYGFWDIAFTDSLIGYSRVEEYPMKTTDGGATWNDIGYYFTGDPISSFFVKDTNHVYLSPGLNCNGLGYPSFYYTTDGGASWLTTDPPLGYYRIHGIFAFSDFQPFICGQYGYAAKMTRPQYFFPLNGEFIYGVYTINPEVYASGSLFYKSTDNGETWNKKDTGFNDYFWYTNFFNPDTGILTGFNLVIRTTDGGNTWTLANNTFTGYKWSCRNTSNSIFVINESALYKSTDYGTTFTNIFTWNYPQYYTYNNYSFLNDQSGWVLKNDSLYRTTNGGANWDIINTTCPVRTIYFFSPDSGYGLSLDTFYCTTDGGITWIEHSQYNFNLYPSEYVFRGPGNFLEFSIGQYLPCVEFLNYHRLREVGGSLEMNYTAPDFTSIHFPNKDHGWFTAAKNIYKLDYDNVPVELTTFTASALNGSVLLKWETVTEKNNQSFEVMRKENNRVYQVIAAIDGKGTTTEKHQYSYTDKNTPVGKVSYKLKQIDYNGNITYSKEADVIILAPEQFALFQNYPNPFNPVTIIKYSLPSAGKVSLKITDILGNTVKELVNETQAPGIYETEFNAAGLASGIYFYTLSSGGFIKTMKLLLLK